MADVSDTFKDKSKTDGALLSNALPPRPGSYSAEELAELERRERMGGWLLLFFGGAAIATAALAFYLFSDDLTPTDQFERLDRPEEVAADTQDDDPFVWGAATPEPEAAGTAEPQATARPRNQQADPGPEAEIVFDSEPQEFDFPGPPDPADSALRFAGPPAGSVDRETNRALRSGKAQLWREQGQRGYVLVSKTVTYGTRECRQVSYTRFEQGQQSTSPSTQWCRLGKSGKWRPDPRGPE